MHLITNVTINDVQLLYILNITICSKCYNEFLFFITVLAILSKFLHSAYLNNYLKLMISFFYTLPNILGSEGESLFSILPLKIDPVSLSLKIYSIDFSFLKTSQIPFYLHFSFIYTFKFFALGHHCLQ